MKISDDSRIRFYLLNGNIVIAQERFTIINLTNYYQQEYLRS